MRRVIVGVIVPILIILGSLLCFLALKFLGVFANGPSLYFSLTLPICVYLSSLVVWMVSQQQKDFVPGIVAVAAFGSFLLGSMILTSSVGLGFSPSPVLDIFFTKEGLSQTLPYFFHTFKSTASPNLAQPIFLFLMIPIALSIIGIFLACFIQTEKPTLFKIRLRQTSIRAGITLLATFFLFFPLKTILFRTSNMS
jgi:hypothetical protein